MKRNLFLYGCVFSLLTFTACKKENISTPPPVTTDNPIEQTVLSKQTAEELMELSEDEKKSLLFYLDSCSKEKRALIVNKIKSLRSAKATNARVADDPNIGEYLNAYDVPQSEEQDANVTATGLGTFTTFFFDWTVARQVTDFYKVMSREKFDCSDKGPSYDINQRYPIESLMHQSSYILGFAPGVSWSENGNNNYTAIYTAYVYTSGILSALGINVQRQSNRYVNAGIVYATGGRELQ